MLQLPRQLFYSSVNKDLSTSIRVMVRPCSRQLLQWKGTGDHSFTCCHAMCLCIYFILSETANQSTQNKQLGVVETT